MVPSGLKLTGNGNADSGNTTAASPGTPRLRTARRTRAAAHQRWFAKRGEHERGRPSIRHRKMRGQSQRRGWYAAIECGLAEPAAGHRLQQWPVPCRCTQRRKWRRGCRARRDAAADEHGAELASILHGSSAGLASPSYGRSRPWSSPSAGFAGAASAASSMRRETLERSARPWFDRLTMSGNSLRQGAVAGGRTNGTHCTAPPGRTIIDRPVTSVETAP